MPDEVVVASELRSLLARSLNDPDAGTVLVEVDEKSEYGAPAAPPADLLNQFLRVHGLEASSSEFHELSRDAAESIATEIFMGPPVGPPLQTPADARQSADAFLGLFDRTARFYSTFQFKQQPNGTRVAVGRALLHSSIESGFLVIDEQRVGCLLYGDED